MSPRITLDQSEVESVVSLPSSGKFTTPPYASRHLARADWDGPTSDALMLYLAGEPRIGDEFSYNDLQWRIIDYRNGWIAELLV